MLDSTVATLRDAALAATDGSGYFAAMHARVTANVRDRVAAGEFADGQRMNRFVAAFAARYVDATATPASAAASWRACFDVAGDESLLIVQHLLLGINAHVNFDLPQTVVSLAGEDDVESLHADFDAVNAVLATTFTELLDDLDRVTRWTGRAAARGGGHLFNFSLVAARQQAWRTAVRMHAETAEARRTDVARLDDVVAVLAVLVCRPTIPFRWVVPLVRRLETRDPVEVTRRLLGPLA